MASKSSGGISIGAIIFWGFIAYTIFGGDDDADDKKVEVVVDDRPAIVEQVKETVEDIKPDVQEIIAEVKNGFVEIRAKVETEINQKKVEPKPEPYKTEEKPKVVDKFGEDDRYGSIEDKW
jgi:hypothetical protein